jgi:hypothetical protein
MKKTGGVPSDLSAEQKAYIQELHSRGYAAVWCAGAEEAIGTIRRYLAGEQILLSGVIERIFRSKKKTIAS